MKKKSTKFNEEIDLIEGFIFIWKNKIKISLFILLSVILSTIYNHLDTKSYQSSISIRSNSLSNFVELQNLHNSLGYDIRLDQKKNPKKKDAFNLLNDYFLERFIRELQDYDEIVHLLKNNEQINNKSGLKFDEKELYRIVKSNFRINRKHSNEYDIKFSWNDPTEAESIILDSLNLTKDSLNKKVFLDLKNILEMNIEKKKKNDLERIKLLTEQSTIAKELSIDNINKFFIPMQNQKKNFDIYLDSNFFLRGHETIDKEISIIKNRTYDEFESTYNQINRLEKMNIDWITYNEMLIDNKLLNKPKSIMIISILIGLVLGILYSIIHSRFQKKRVFNKN